MNTKVPMMHKIYFYKISFFTGPICPAAPEIPYEARAQYIPQIFEVENKQTCSVDRTVQELICPSFLSVYVRQTVYGRTLEGAKTLCNGNQDVAKLLGNCQLNKGTPSIQKHCNGRMSCTVNISHNITNWNDSCVENHVNEMNITYTCGKYYFFIDNMGSSFKKSIPQALKKEYLNACLEDLNTIKTEKIRISIVF